MNSMTATTMPEAIRQNRTDLETGHPPAGATLFGQWSMRSRRNSSGDMPVSWDGLDAASLDAGTSPTDVIRRAGQQTGLEIARSRS